MKQAGQKYLHAWHALGAILRDGGSWSGNEKNCCFLNTRTGDFVDVSFTVGLDRVSDSRAVALSDWDQDGDLDLWYSNRTAPRVSYLQNDSRTGNGYLAVRLRGSKSNRDAIGAYLELETTLEGKASSSIQTLRAGEGFLAQSSKWVHFGLGRAKPVRLRVRWPSGDEQSFTGMRSNARYLIVEGQDPLEMAARQVPAIADVKLPEPTVEPTQTIVSSRRMPLPQLQLLNEDGQAFHLARNADSHRLIMLWATWCKPCVAELLEFEQHAVELSSAGVEWLPVNVDEVQSGSVEHRRQLAQTLMAKIGVSAPVTLATQSAVECLDVTQRVLVTKQSPLPVPCSFLIDPTGDLMAVYKGPTTVAQIRHDVIEFERPTADPRDVSIPFPGTWIMDPYPPDLMAIPTELVNIGRSQEALEYLTNHVPLRDFPPPVTVEQLSGLYIEVGQDLFQKQRTAEAEMALTNAQRVDASSVEARMALGEVYLIQGKRGEAIRQYRTVLEIVPQQPLSLNNLAWLLATSADESLRNPTEAVALAKRLCEMTNYDEPLSLDTLAVALAANGDFEPAVLQLDKSIRLSTQSGRSTSRMEARRELFKARKPFIER